jgi:hypothetical protein
VVNALPIELCASVVGFLFMKKHDENPCAKHSVCLAMSDLSVLPLHCGYWRIVSYDFMPGTDAFLSFCLPLLALSVMGKKKGVGFFRSLRSEDFQDLPFASLVSTYARSTTDNFSSLGQT